MLQNINSLLTFDYVSFLSFFQESRETYDSYICILLICIIITYLFIIYYCNRYKYRDFMINKNWIHFYSSKNVIEILLIACKKYFNFEDCI